MSVTVSYHITCDVDSCEGEDSPGRVCDTLEQAENDFEGRGWSFADGEIRCPDHAPEATRADT